MQCLLEYWHHYQPVAYDYATAENNTYGQIDYVRSLLCNPAVFWNNEMPLITRGEQLARVAMFKNGSSLSRRGLFTVAGQAKHH